MEALKKKTPVRLYSGECWRTNQSNKKRLAIDFEEKCAYCDDHHSHGGGYAVYHVEHFAPKEKFKHLKFVYDNLLYSCPYCNGAKSDKWVGSSETESVVGEKGFIDPCSDAYNEHLRRKKEDGSIVHITELGKYMYKELKLYLKRHELIYNMEKIWIKKHMLKTKIDEMQQKGDNTAKLSAIYQELCAVFCDYYELLIKK